MHQLKKTALACVVLCSTFSSLPVRANDISIFAYSPVQPLDASDPLMQALQVDEIDVWGRIRKGFAIPDLDNALVTTQTTWYSARPDNIQRITARSSRYLYHVVQELEKRNMPTELALLPFIESAFNPQALSTAQASGLWQFIPSTGKDFNLKQNVFRDERRDVLASTDAALTYLQKLYGMFGDWQLALAAYNWGEGSVMRAQAKARAAGGPTDFNGLSMYMPNETRNYVPRLQAIKNIIAAPGQYGIGLPRVDNQPYFVTVSRTSDIDVKLAAELAELPMDEFKALNPQFNRPVITGGENTQILLPKGNAEKFQVNLSKWGQALSSWTSHKVTGARERIETIAARFRTTPEVIRQANNIPPKMVLREGSTIIVPKSGEMENLPAFEITSVVADNATMTMEAERPPTKRIHVKVGKRDTLSTIAARYDVSIDDIKSWNSLRRDVVARGQSLALVVPNNGRSVAAPVEDRPKARGAAPASRAVVAKNSAAKPKVRKVAHAVAKKPPESKRLARRD